MHRTAIAALVACPLAATVVVSAPVQAGGTTPFTIHEVVDFTGGGANTFTATSPLCPSGTFTDEVHNFAPNSDSSAAPDNSGGLNLQIRTVFTCDDGSGSFYALKNLRITFLEDGTTSTGPIQLMGGTGAYTRLRGHGVDNGTASFDEDFGEGLITGVLVGVP